MLLLPAGEPEQSPLVHVRSQMDREQSSLLIAEMLSKLISDEPLEQRNVVIPVELCRPKISGTEGNGEK